LYLHVTHNCNLYLVKMFVSYTLVPLLLVAWPFYATLASDIEVIYTDMDDTVLDVARTTLNTLYDENAERQVVADNVMETMASKYGRFWSVYISTEQVVSQFHAAPNTTLRVRVNNQDYVTAYRHEFLNQEDFVEEGQRHIEKRSVRTSLRNDVVNRFVFKFGSLLSKHHDFTSLADASVTLMKEEMPDGQWVCDVASRGETSFKESTIDYLQVTYGDIVRITLLNAGNAPPPTNPPTDADKIESI